MPWELHFAEGMAGHRFGVIGKVHHAHPDTCSPPSTAELLRAAGRDHLEHVKELPGVVRDSVAGISRVRRRAGERGEHPDLARAFKPPPTFINHVVSPARTFASRRCRWPK